MASREPMMLRMSNAPAVWPPDALAEGSVFLSDMCSLLRTRS